MTGNTRGLRDPLSPEIVQTIDEIEPQAHLPGFWERLEAAVEADGLDLGQMDDATPSATVGRRLLAVAAAVVLLVALAIVVADRSPTPLQRIDSATERGDAPPTTGSTVTPPTTAAAMDGLVSEPTTAVDASANDEGAGSEPVVNSTGPTSPTETTALGSSSSTTSTTISAPEPSVNSLPPSTAPVPALAPQRIEAERMAVKTYGGQDPGAYRLYSDGYVEDQVDLAATGRYRFTVRARGESDTALRPEMELSVSGLVAGSIPVELDGYRRYTFEADVEAGRHPLRIAFTNDPNRPDNDVDLIIDRVDVASIDG